jgi:hypothetical protein
MQEPKDSKHNAASSGSQQNLRPSQYTCQKEFISFVHSFHQHVKNAMIS